MLSLKCRLAFPVDSWIYKSGIQQSLEINADQRDGTYSTEKEAKSGEKQTLPKDSEDRGSYPARSLVWTSHFFTTPWFLIFEINGLDSDSHTPWFFGLT